MSRGFSLLELVVVLAILAALSTVALRSTQGLDDRVRFDATRRVLEEVREAILGVHTADSFRPGFLSDLDRLPVDPSELWLAPYGIARNHVETLAGGSGELVALSTGWRGPYLTRAPGANQVNDGQISDGWGQPLILETLDGGYVLRSLGKDRLVGGAGYDADLEIPIVDPNMLLDLASSHVTLIVHIETLPESYNADTDTTLSVSTVACSPHQGTGELLASTESALVSELFPGMGSQDLPLILTRTVAMNAGTRAFLARLGDEERTLSTAALHRVLPHGTTIIELALD